MSALFHLIHPSSNLGLCQQPYAAQHNNISSCSSTSDLSADCSRRLPPLRLPLRSAAPPVAIE
ncbi:hypothetical protein HanPSC8_Chr01g0035351 [Helianthus annuus]|nr:hypothetical protein HanPSC8_Chr01g0035351 [Helianthus annuus]